MLLCSKLNKAFQNLLLLSFRSFSTKNPYLIERLDKRTLLRLSGNDTSKYLQNMMTNDLQNFKTLPSLYSLLLNPSGRCLYDIILYKLHENEYLVEYDATGVEYLHRHLLMYRMRKDVKIQPLTNLSAWVVYNEFGDPITREASKDIVNQVKNVNGVISCVEDPRLIDLGVRIITENNVDLPKALSTKVECNISDSYRLLRYKLGVGEGVLDHPPGECDPIDINVDLLNGVSFTKGCYIGQEMTAKSHNVYIIRKRLMPVTLQRMDSYPSFPPECSIVNEKGSKLGRFRSHFGQFGLGLLKYEDCERSKIIKFKDFDISLEVKRPRWWPSNLSSGES